jgi:integrase
MPKIKTRRADILRRQEIVKMLKDSGYIKAWLPCLIALLWLFGKRISENLALTKDSFSWDNEYLYVRFNVLKKRKRKDPSVPRPYVKRITRQHLGTEIIINYVNQCGQGKIFKVSRQLARYYFRKVTDQAWFHLFRESLATEMAEHGATEEDLMHWFDWDRVDTAHEYVKRGTKLTEKWSERTW